MNNNEDEILMYINNELKDIQNTINKELYYKNKKLNSRNEINEIKKNILKNFYLKEHLQDLLFCQVFEVLENL